MCGENAKEIKELITEFDENGRIIYIKHPNGFEERYKYNSNGQIICSKSNNVERRYKDNKIYYMKFKNGQECWIKNGKLNHFKFPNGYEVIDFDENGIVILHENKNSVLT